MSNASRYPASSTLAVLAVVLSFGVLGGASAAADSNGVSTNAGDASERFRAVNNAISDMTDRSGAKSTRRRQLQGKCSRHVFVLAFVYVCACTSSAHQDSLFSCARSRRAYACCVVARGVCVTVLRVKNFLSAPKGYIYFAKLSLIIYVLFYLSGCTERHCCPVFWVHTAGCCSTLQVGIILTARHHGTSADGSLIRVAHSEHERLITRPYTWKQEAKEKERRCTFGIFRSAILLVPLLASAYLSLVCRVELGARVVAGDYNIVLPAAVALLWRK